MLVLNFRREKTEKIASRKVKLEEGVEEATGRRRTVQLSLQNSRWWLPNWHSKLCLNKTRGWKIISLLKSVQKVEFEFVSLSFNLIRVEISAWPRVNVLAVKYQNKVQNYQFCFIKKAEIFQWWTARQKEAIWLTVNCSLLSNVF